MTSKLKQLFSFATWHLSSHKRLIQTLERATDEELAAEHPSLIYYTLERLQDFILKNAQLRNAFAFAANGHKHIDERHFSKEIEVIKKLSKAGDFTDTLKAHVMGSVIKTANWVARNKPRIIGATETCVLDGFLREMLDVQFNALSCNGIELTPPDITYTQSPTKSLGWIFASKVRKEHYRQPEIFINVPELEGRTLDDVLMTVFHEGIHCALSQVARLMALGNIEKDSPLYDDALKLLVKNDLRYTAKTEVVSVYYHDPEERLAHRAHERFLDLALCASITKQPLILRNPITA